MSSSEYIPFCVPVINEDVVEEMVDTLRNTGWLTTGPKARLLEQELQTYTGASAVLCVNSWTSGAMLMLRWYGIGPGDEVIVPAYTYCATAMCVLNMGATPVMVDVREDFNIDPHKLRAAITPRTKAIIPVDVGGLPCDYSEINRIVASDYATTMFQPSSEKQRRLGRILVISDSAHSLGAVYRGRAAGTLTDVTIFSFHSVKNITTGEGGAICLNLPEPFDNPDELPFLRALSLNGQTKSAFEKNQAGAWKYDIVAQGLKVNMPDLCAAVGLAQLRSYGSELLPERKDIHAHYHGALSQHEWAILPIGADADRESSYHLFLLRVKDFAEEQRDRMIQEIAGRGVGVNVHYIPMPMLTLFKELGYQMSDYPVAHRLYQNEITLPIYNNLNENDLTRVVQAVEDSFEAVC